MSYAVLIVPDFALQALRRADPTLVGRPVAHVSGEGRKACIAEVSAEAVDVTPGLVVTLAMARCPGLVIRPRDMNAEAEASRLLLAAAFTLSPRIERTAAGCCTVDLQGVDPARTEAQMRACVTDLGAVGLVARAGSGATPLLAFYAAQRAAPVLVVHETRGFLRPLPLDVAEPTAEQATILRGWGVATLGDLTDLPKAEIGARLGTEGVRLWERATGETTRVLCLVEPTRTFVTEWIYEPPVESIEPLLFRMRRFAECLALELRGAGLVAEKLALTLRLEDENDYRREFRLPEPSADFDGWMRVLHGHLETVKTESRVAGVSLVASPARPPEKQDGLFETGLRDPAVFWENLARLSAIVGDDCVGTPRVGDTWRPDTVILEKPAEIVPAPEPDPVHPPRGMTLRRFRPPWPARVTVAEERPVTVATTTFQEDVREACGPFRLNGAWWKPRETWQVEIWHVETSSGAIYQLARTNEGWCAEGVFD